MSSTCGLGTAFCCSLEGNDFCLRLQMQEWNLIQPLLTRCGFLMFRSLQKINTVGICVPHGSRGWMLWGLPCKPPVLQRCPTEVGTWLSLQLSRNPPSPLALPRHCYHSMVLLFPQAGAVQQWALQGHGCGGSAPPPCPLEADLSQRMESLHRL